MRTIRAIIVCTFIATLMLPAAAALAQDASISPPQPLAGQGSFATNCAPCHGTTGMGDGPSASGLGVEPTALGDYDKIAARSLQELFDITKTGNMQRMMPPWGGRLSDQEIWNTVAYAWSLHTSRDEVESGQSVYDASCASCHGPDGKGGAQSSGPDLTDFSVTNTASQAQWAQAVAEGKTTMPAFKGKLSDAEQRAALVYVRSLSLGGPLFRPPLSAGAGVISGTITNGTTGKPMPDLTVQLGIFDQTSQLEQRTATTDAAGVYRFSELPTDTTLAFASRVEYPPDIPYSSAFVSFEEGKSELDLPLPVFETTDDASGVRAERVHYIVEFENGLASIAELMVFSLDGDRAYVGDGTHVLRFPLPVGAQNLAVNEGELGGRFVQIESGFVDLMPLTPGQSVRQVLFRYTLPYSGSALELVRSLPYPANNVNALIADVGQTIDSGVLVDQGKRSTEGGSYYNFLAQNVPANQEVRISMTGLPSSAGGGVSSGRATGATGNAGGLNRWVVIGLIALAAAIAALVVALPLARSGRGQRHGVEMVQGSGDTNDLIDALAQLDLAHEAGEIPDSAYRDRRMQLKARLRDLMRKEAQE